MTVVIADSSPLNYLTLIGSVDVLHRLYGTVVASASVSLATATAMSASRVKRGLVRAETASPPTNAKGWRVLARSAQM